MNINQIMRSQLNTNPIEVATALSGLEYPANKERLIDCALENHARAAVIKVINRVANKKYKSPAEISKEICDVSKYDYF